MDHRIEKSRELIVAEIVGSRTGCYQIANGLKLRRVANMLAIELSIEPRTVSGRGQAVC
ncbi:hypothetical protein F2Q70_00038392 [Brassica cretica]|uniref:Uncharacterized protein n=2 Tax=Brassica cretica TaxID=69181 RepID=A0A3N6RLM0_BRACR|nr:hypothetical protein F2Q70_00038392 [Brassica cretica]KAF2619679.1 hypothetical protein F2Q68_00039014 [Brassica cretica]KAF3497826.1 hypothetical protein DY000_02052595 [Brassica cretica]